MPRTVRILGTHGVPAAYGGFETAAENVARYLVAKGWHVIVYCQLSGTGPIFEDVWEGIHRVNIPVELPGWRGTSKFDLLSIKHACQFKDVCLTFGYNTALYNLRQWIKGIPNVINMDGIEWSRKRWGFTKQAILYVNERIACFIGNDLIADHPVIKTYLQTRARASKITTITYGADPVNRPSADSLASLGLKPKNYFTLIARPIPENSILEIVQGFSRRPREHNLVILGNYLDTDPYHRAVRDAASKEVLFIGAIYEPDLVQALRYHGIGYVHGHTVGGTNPSLVEALAAHNPVIAHDNPYNRWVAQDAALYFSNAASFSDQMDAFLASPSRTAAMSQAATKRYTEEFTWDRVAGQYEQLLLKHIVD